jgi:hypothetical protein
MSALLLQPEIHLLSLADYLVKDQRNNTTRANQVAALYFPHAAGQALGQALLLAKIAQLIINGPQSKDQIIALVTSTFSNTCIPQVLALARRFIHTLIGIHAMFNRVFLSTSLFLLCTMQKIYFNLCNMFEFSSTAISNQAISADAPPPQKEEHEDFEGT